MSVEILKSIKEAEGEAELLRKQSVADSKQIISEANLEGKKLFEQLLHEAETEAGMVISQAEATAVKEIAALEQAVMDDCNKIREHAGAGMNKAIDVVMGRIMSTYGNS